MISGRTKVYGLIGHPVDHSLSPKLHNAYFQNEGLDAVYLAFDVTPGQVKGAIESLRALGIWGVNVTAPHKEAVIPYLDGLSGDAKVLQAVNTICREKDRLIGYNTDGVGVRRLFSHHQVEVKGKKVAVLGSGGAAKAAVLALIQEEAASTCVFSRTKQKRQALVERFDAPSLWEAELSRFKDHASSFDVVINATPVGMGVLKDQTPLTLQELHKKMTVIDLIYHPHPTILLTEARKKGCQAVAGHAMLVGQAAESMGLWLGRDVDTMTYLQIFEED